MKRDSVMQLYGGKRPNHRMLFLVVFATFTMILIPSYFPLINLGTPKCPTKPLVNFNEMRDKLYNTLWEGLPSSSIILLPSAPKHEREESDMETPSYR
jgi:hypothetical protein